MEIGYLVGGIACAVYGLFCILIGALRPQSLMKFVKLKLKMFAGSKELSDKATATTCYVFGALGLAAAVLLFVLGAVNA